MSALFSTNLSAATAVCAEAAIRAAASHEETFIGVLPGCDSDVLADLSGSVIRGLRPAPPLQRATSAESCAATSARARSVVARHPCERNRSRRRRRAAATAVPRPQRPRQTADGHPVAVLFLRREAACRFHSAAAAGLWQECARGGRQGR